MQKLCYVSFKGSEETENITFLFDNDGKDIWKKFMVPKEKRQVKDFLKKNFKFVTTNYTVDRLANLGVSINLDKIVDVKEEFKQVYECEKEPTRLDMMIAIGHKISETEPESAKVKGHHVCKTYRVIYQHLIDLEQNTFELA